MNLQRTLQLSVAALALFATTACVTSQLECEPGSSKACTCEDSTGGRKICRVDGTWAQCVSTTTNNVCKELVVDAGTTTPADAGTTTPADAGTTTPADAGTTTPADAGTTTPADAGTTTPADAGTTTPADAGTTTPADGGAH